MSDFPEAGDTMPDIAMETPDGGTVKPSDFKGKKLVVFFYPKDNTPGCTTEAKDFTVLKHDFDKVGVELLGVSKDSAKKHQNFIAKHDLKTQSRDKNNHSDDGDGGLFHEFPCQASRRDSRDRAVMKSQKIVNTRK